MAAGAETVASGATGAAGCCCGRKKNHQSSAAITRAPRIHHSQFRSGSSVAAERLVAAAAVAVGVPASGRGAVAADNGSRGQQRRPQPRRAQARAGGTRRPRPPPHSRSRLPGWCDRSLAAQDCGRPAMADCPLPGNRADSPCLRWRAPHPPGSTRPTRCPQCLQPIDRHRDRSNRRWHQANPKLREPIRLSPGSGTRSETAEAH